MGKVVILTLTKAQYNVLWQLEKNNIPASNIKPATLGFLCAHQMVNVHRGMVSMCNSLLYFVNNGHNNFKAKVWKD